MKVKDALHGITKVSYLTTITEAAVIMDKRKIGSVLIEENGKVIGIMTERDILKKIVAKGENPNKVTVKEIMSSPLITIDANAELSVASSIMEKNNIRRLVVTDNKEIVGIITTRDVSNNVNYLLAKGATAYFPPVYY